MLRSILMHDLKTLIALNNRAAAAANAPAESETTRHCSYAKGPNGGLVLHSAKLRSTGFLAAKEAKNFLVSWFATNSATKRDRLVESYF